MKGRLYLIPNTLGGNDPSVVIPGKASCIISELEHFIVENVRNARRYILKIDAQKSIDDTRFFVLNKHTSPEEISSFLKPCLEGKNMGLISEAGVPAVADPGAQITSLAHKMGITVIPLSGPSSVILSLMASGLNGQEFTFHGYLPIDRHERTRAIRRLDKMVAETGFTQIFIETPYRNEKLFADILKNSRPETRLCVACNLTMEEESIHTRPVSEWKKVKINIHKQVCIFLLGR